MAATTRAKNKAPLPIAIIGCGNMGTALADKLSSKEDIVLYDHHFEKAHKLALRGFGKAASSLKEALLNAKLVILAIKPQSLSLVAMQLKEHLQDDQLIVSLLAGISLDNLRKHFPSNLLVRLMPNLPILCGQGMLALASEEQEKKLIQEHIKGCFSVLGTVIWLPEAKFDAFTALAGSGPAFIFTIIEAIIESGIAMGFSAAEAKEILLQTMQGSVELMKVSEKHPGELKWQVASPAGTTIAGLICLEEHAVRSGLIQTFLATYERTKRIK